MLGTAEEAAEPNVRGRLNVACSAALTLENTHCIAKAAMTRTATSSNCCVTAETAPETALLQKTPPRQSRESDDDARFRTASERLRAQHNLTPPHTVLMVWAHGTEALHALVEHLYTYDGQ